MVEWFPVQVLVCILIFNFEYTFTFSEELVFKLVLTLPKSHHYHENHEISLFCSIDKFNMLHRIVDTNAHCCNLKCKVHTSKSLVYVESYESCWF